MRSDSCSMFLALTLFKPAIINPTSTSIVSAFVHFMLQSSQPLIHCSLPSLPFNFLHYFLINSPLLVGSMASPSLSNSSTQLGRRMLSEFLEEPQEPFLFEMRKLSNQGGRAAAFLKRVLAKLGYGKKISSADNRKSNVFSCFSDYSNDHQLSPVSVLELQYSDESSPSLDDHYECPLPSGADSSMENSIILEEIDDHKSVSFNKRRRHLLECWRKETEERILSFLDGLNCSDMSENAARNELIFSWEKPMGDSSRSSCREEWNQFKAEARQIGLSLEAAIFDELREETILDILVLYCT